MMRFGEPFSFERVVMNMEDIAMNYKFTVCLFAVVVASLIGTNPAAGQAFSYLKVGEIEGDAFDIGYEGWSNIETYEISVQNDGWQPGSSGPVVSLSQMYVTKLTDKASPLLMHGVWTGEVFEEAFVDVVVEAGTQPHLLARWTFEDAVLSGYSAVFDSQLAEIVAIDFRRVIYTYYPTDSTGAIEVSYDRLGSVPTVVGSMSAGFELLTQFESAAVPEPGVALLTGVAAVIFSVSRFPRHLRTALRDCSQERRTSCIGEP